jgi:hypothetical protein
MLDSAQFSRWCRYLSLVLISYILFSSLLNPSSNPFIKPYGLSQGLPNCYLISLLFLALSHGLISPRPPLLI